MLTKLYASAMAVFLVMYTADANITTANNITDTEWYNPLMGVIGIATALLGLAHAFWEDIITNQPLPPKPTLYAGEEK